MSLYIMLCGKKSVKEIIRILTLIHSDSLKSSPVSQYYFSVLGKDKVDVAPAVFVTECEARSRMVP